MVILAWSRLMILFWLSQKWRNDGTSQYLPSLKRIGARLIALVGAYTSTLAKNADVILDASVEKKPARWAWHRRQVRLWLSP